jgi:hypothetical protein
MPLYRKQLAQKLEERKSEFNGTIGEEVVEQYQEAVQKLEDLSKEELENKLDEMENPGALPTEEFKDVEGVRIIFDESSNWETHEAVNKWARDQIENVTTVAADGSQIDPVKEFEKPVGLVQVVWMANDHKSEKSYEEDVDIVVLTPEDLLFEDPNTGFVQVDSQEVPVKRFETEMKVLERQIKKHSGDENPPVVMYDGSLILSFVQMFDQKTQKRYGEALARLLAASKHHGVPVVGYVSGSKATELGRMMDKLEIVETSRSVRDYQALENALENWGDRTPLFQSRRDSTLNLLETTYHGEEYDFSEDILFSYLKTDPGAQIDRIEMPSWILEEGLAEHVFSVIRAEAGIGRGYPEILQAVDADAVLSNNDRQDFLRMFQDFSTEHDIELDWNNKALSKKRRRR